MLIADLEMEVLKQLPSKSVTICATCRRDIVFPVHIPLNDGHIPSPIEKCAMQTYIQETLDSLAKLDTYKQAVQQVMDSMNAVEFKLRHALAVQRAYVAPIRRVPAELLEIIFEWSCMEATLGPDSCTPLDISAVCKQWRGMYSHIRVQSQKSESVFRGHAQLSSHMVEHAAHKPPLQRMVTTRTGREAPELLPEHDERLPAFSAYTREPGYRMQTLEPNQDTGQAYGSMATFPSR